MNTAVVALVEVKVGALVDMHIFDIDPDDPANISCLRACEWIHAAPQSVRVKDVA